MGYISPNIPETRSKFNNLHQQ